MSDDKLFCEKVLEKAKKISLGEKCDGLSEFNIKQAKKLWEWISGLPEQASFVLDAGFPHTGKSLPHLKVFLPIKMRKDESYTDLKQLRI